MTINSPKTSFIFICFRVITVDVFPQWTFADDWTELETTKRSVNFAVASARVGFSSLLITAWTFTLNGLAQCFVHSLPLATLTNVVLAWKNIRVDELMLKTSCDQFVHWLLNIKTSDRSEYISTTFNHRFIARVFTANKFFSWHFDANSYLVNRETSELWAKVCDYNENYFSR